MKSERINATELKRRQIEIGFQGDVRRATALKARVDLHRNTLAELAAHFRATKEQLAKMLAKPLSPKQALQITNEFVTKLTQQRKGIGAVEKRLNETLVSKESLAAKLVMDKSKLEKLDGMQKSKQCRLELLCELEQQEELQEVSIAKQLADQDGPIRADFGIDCGSNAVCVPTALAEVNRVHSVGVNKPLVAPASQPLHAQAGPPDFTRQIEDLRTWRDLAGSGVEFAFTSTQGSKYNLQFNAVVSGGVRVVINPESEKERRMLWDEKREIVAALQQAGVQVERVELRGQ